MRSLLVWTLLHSTPYFERLMPSPDVRRDAPSTASADCSGRSGRFPGCCWELAVRGSTFGREACPRTPWTPHPRPAVGPAAGPSGVCARAGARGPGAGGASNSTALPCRRTQHTTRHSVLHSPASSASFSPRRSSIALGQTVRDTDIPNVKRPVIGPSTPNSHSADFIRKSLTGSLGSRKLPRLVPAVAHTAAQIPPVYKG